MSDVTQFAGLVEQCETCNGTGTDPDLDEVYEGNCLECNGEGTLVDPEICADCEESTAAGTPDPVDAQGRLTVVTEPES